MIDISDGLLQDLGHLCEESHVGAVIEAQTVPLSAGYRALLGERDLKLALTGGEDYELLFSAPAEHRAIVGTLAQRCNCPITRIGRVVSEAEGLSIQGPDGTRSAPAYGGFDHFRQS
jgi:thiamine-monophosphate kinase